ncbi:uncharacterized protein CC84DRAFT_1104677 [Paraphaeosphaeria sporulosa]|uniref:HD domain-containing protein n=1 Tax=Paraphaeosphaeria sporulosa TaxID=1460663 RepID=A0A177BY01_9PLEO|nr:uncharacterized protein CC84DRAFT_1104677 [Paraphaeosphaeria sporulosa]OAF99209.1 hypothetical protein CC84DRAFT_1104677 [Paraphaeosphaeria sporulosa]
MVAISHLLTRVIAGIPVPNTPLINSSIALTRAALPDQGYNHVMRSWLNGQAIINNLPATNRSKIDQEAFGIATILHDLGWSNDTTYISPDKRFEIDGAIAARTFLQAHGGPTWRSAQRLQLVFDIIALHSTASIARYKQPEVAIASGGILTELLGPSVARTSFGELITVSQAQWEDIARAYPREDVKEYFNGVMVGLCTMKPDTTWDNFVSDYGEVLIEGFNRTGHRTVDLTQMYLVD